MKVVLFAVLFSTHLLFVIRADDAAATVTNSTTAANATVIESPAHSNSTISGASTIIDSLAQNSTSPETSASPRNDSSTSISTPLDKSTGNTTDSSNLSPELASTNTIQQKDSKPDEDKPLNSAECQPTSQNTTSTDSPPANPEPLPKPEHPLALPDFRQFRYENFMNNFDYVLRDLTRIQESRFSSTGRLREHFESVRRSAIEQIDRIHRNISNDIFYNRTMSSAKKSDYLDRIGKSYQEAINHTDSIIEAQTAAVTTLLASLNIDKDISDLIVAIEKIVDGQMKTANRLLEIPPLIQDNINAGYVGLEKIVKEVKADLDDWRYT